ncbi:CD63 antigen [Exaiptasia diaphana]|uniref:Tetraspanin n=1 Tax=Exaiptasia diaphana TaxID=2652724 RepID=A0A913XS30_EXADI|nr:CD63 antigen [Exaiptasia diaphana]KXJ24970.1 CD63 antigen [Exaiptasia diaphana]
MAEKLGPCLQCIRYLLFVFNALFWVMGCGVLSVGVWAIVQFNDYMKLSSHDFAIAAYILIGVGFFIAIVGFIGCCGALREHTCLLKTFAVILGFLFLVELGTAITGYVFRDEIKSGFNEGLDSALDKYSDAGFKDVWDNMQSNLHCCGSKNYTDWFGKKKSTSVSWNTSVPESCCRTKTKNCNVDVTLNPRKIYSDKSCYTAAVEYIEDKMIIIGSVALAIAVFQLIGITFSCCLAATLQNLKMYELV